MVRRSRVVPVEKELRGSPQRYLKTLFRKPPKVKAVVWLYMINTVPPVTAISVRLIKAIEILRRSLWL